MKPSGTHIAARRAGGFSLLEVVVGIFVFVVGLLALASLQGALTRTMADSKLRTEAATLAESLIEAQRGFTTLSGAPPGEMAFADIVSTSDPMVIQSEDGMTYSLTQSVTDYYYDSDTDDFVTTAPTGAVSPDFKDVAVTVTWTSPEFRGTETMSQVERGLGSGSVTISASIPAVLPSDNIRVINQEPDNAFPTIPMGYTPGQAPDVIPLALGEGRFKESLVPKSWVDDQAGLIKTELNVLTYSFSGDRALLQRREEFTAVPCKCTLRAADADQPGRRPVVWAGDEYAGGHFVAKPYGERAQEAVQSPLCEACCRDHHDGGSSSEDHSSDGAYDRYGPFKASSEHVSGSFDNDHLHYTELGDVAGNGDDYLEVCRLVRVDGFFRVTHDFRQEDQYAFPGDFFDQQSEVDTWSGYVTTAANDYYEAAGDDYSVTSPVPCIGSAGCAAQPTMQGDYPALLADGQLPSWTTLPVGGEDSQQLRSRGIFIDYLSEDLRTYMQDTPLGCLDGGDVVEGCCVVDGAVADDCSGEVFALDQTGRSNLLEVIPFFDVSKTLLDRWNESPPDTPVETTNQEIADASAHDRGTATHNALGDATAQARNHRGNLGFTNTQPIDPEFTANEVIADLHVETLDAGTGDGGEAADWTDPIISGAISHDLNGNPPFRITAGGSGEAYCERTPRGYQCSVISTHGNPTFIVSGYGVPLPVQTCDPALDPTCVLIPATTRFACAEGLKKIAESPAGAGDLTWAEFRLKSEPAGDTYDIHVTETSADPCP